MGWSKEWDELFRENPRHLTSWPWSDLVSNVMRHAKPLNAQTNVLELGCGAGANIPFFNSLGVNYYAIEGSPFIVEKLRSAYPAISEKIVAEDFTQSIPFPGMFDLVVDRCSLTHNTTEKIRNSLELVWEKLRTNGLFIGIDWFSTHHSDYSLGIQNEDVYTKSNVHEGHLANTGRIHFSDAEHLKDLFHKFEFISLEHKVVERNIPDEGFRFAAWNFVVRKK